MENISINSCEETTKIIFVSFLISIIYYIYFIMLLYIYNYYSLYLYIFFTI